MQHVKVLFIAHVITAYLKEQKFQRDILAHVASDFFLNIQCKKKKKGSKCECYFCFTAHVLFTGL